MTGSTTPLPHSAFTVDPEFATLCPAYVGEDADELEKSLLAHGVREPLVIWQEARILLDGHRRLGICDRHRIATPTVEYSFPDRQAARAWIVANQLARRNLTRDQRDLLIGRCYVAERKDPADTRRQGDVVPCGQSDQAGSTAARVAAAAKVSEKTVRRAARFAADVDRIGETCPEAKAEILAGRLRIGRNAIHRAAKEGATLATLRTLAAAGSARKSRPKRQYLRRIDVVCQQLESAIRSYQKAGLPIDELKKSRSLTEVVAHLARLGVRAPAMDPTDNGQGA